MALFRMAYPRYPDISRIYVSTTEREYHVDLRPVMNHTPTTTIPLQGSKLCQQLSTVLHLLCVAALLWL